MKYIALLRGINVGGNNKVTMPQLRQCFEALGFENVTTYINSGNVIFDTISQPLDLLTRRCEGAIKNYFGFEVVCVVLSSRELKKAVLAAPAWWGGSSHDKHNALFVKQPLTPAGVMQHIGETKPEYEKVASVGSVIFWTAPLETFGRTRYSKIVGTDVYKYITIRNANTVKKLVLY